MSRGIVTAERTDPSWTNKYLASVVKTSATTTAGFHALFDFIFKLFNVETAFLNCIVIGMGSEISILSIELPKLAVNTVEKNTIPIAPANEDRYFIVAS